MQRLKKLTDTGGSKAAAAALAQLAIAAGLYAAPIIGDKSLPEVGYWSVNKGVVSEFASEAKCIEVQLEEKQTFSLHHLQLQN